MSITRETRRSAYDEIVENLGKRQKIVYEGLTDELTANELAIKLWKEGSIHTPDRNNVHPRLNELVIDEVIEIVGKRKCMISGKTCAVYKRKSSTAATIEQLKIF